MSNVSWLGRRNWTWTVYLPLVAVGLGTLVRVVAFLHRRSLWLDEAMVAHNVAHRGYGALAKPLTLHQGAPLGWLWAQRTAFLLFGENEYAWRIVPLLCGVGTLLATWVVARRLLPRRFVVVPVVLVAVNTALLDYSTEGKQYATDALVATGLLALTLPLLERITARRLAVWTAAGVVAVWCSHPAMFFVAAYATAVGVAALLRRDGRGLLLAAAGSAAVAASFLVDYLAILRHTDDDPVLIEYWRVRGFPPPGRSAWWAGQALTRFFETPAGLTPVKYGVVMVGAGLVAYGLRRPALALALALPCAALLAASELRKYPFAGRMTLGLTPLAALAASGLLAARWKAVRAAGLAGLLVLTAGPAATAADRLVHPRDQQVVRAALEHVRARLGPGDRVVVLGHGYPEFAYYARVLRVRIDATVRYTPQAHDCDDRADLALATAGGGRVWLLLAQTTRAQRADLPERFAAIGPRTDTFEPPGAWVYAYTPGPAGPPAVRRRQCVVLEAPQPLAS
jgi:hypothetical protein